MGPTQRQLCITQPSAELQKRTIRFLHRLSLCGSKVNRRPDALARPYRAQRLSNRPLRGSSSYRAFYLLPSNQSRNDH